MDCCCAPYIFNTGQAAITVRVNVHIYLLNEVERLPRHLKLASDVNNICIPRPDAVIKKQMCLSIMYTGKYVHQGSIIINLSGDFALPSQGHFKISIRCFLPECFSASPGA